MMKDEIEGEFNLEDIIPALKDSEKRFESVLTRSVEGGLEEIHSQCRVDLKEV